MKQIKNNKGFSLIEIMVALGLLVVIGGIAVQQFNEYRKTAKKQAINSTISQIEQVVATCAAIEQDPSATCFGAFDSATSTFVNKTLKTKSGIAVVQENGASLTTCYWAYENAGANPTTTPAKVPVGKYFGNVQFTKASGAKKASAEANNPAGATENISCTD